MGGCANSKYAVDEDKEKKPINKENLKKEKRTKKEKKELISEVKIQVTGPDSKNNENVKKDSTPKVDKEEIEFIDKEDVLRQQSTIAINQQAIDVSSEKLNFDAKNNLKDFKSDEKDDEKKEVTTYQTTIIKHSQKEGEELLQHLKDEAFITLHNLLKNKNNTNQNANSPIMTSKTTKTSSVNSAQEKSTKITNDLETSENIIQQIKEQVADSLGKSKEININSIIDHAAVFIKENKVNCMNDLQLELEKAFSNDKDLVKKVINATTGFLTAKGTEAGAILSNILANVSNGIQGIMNETEKTTVKVTRTVTEQIMSDGQLKEISKIVLSNVENPDTNMNSVSNIDEILKTFNKTSLEGINKTSGSANVDESVHLSEKIENEKDAILTKKKAEQVVNTVVNAAVEKIMDETCNKNNLNYSRIDGNNNENNKQKGQITEEKIKIEEENTIKCSTTKIILKNDNIGKELVENSLDQVQSEFFRNGKTVAEDLIKKIDITQSILNP